MKPRRTASPASVRNPVTQSAHEAVPIKVAAVIPAYNEAGRIGRVLETLTAVPELDEIIVVSDGSTDDTYQVARRFSQVQVIQLPRNKGKGGAMREGAMRTDADVLIFFDADLIHLTPQHVRDLLAPVCAGEASMAMGIFYGGRWATDMAQRIVPAITGQRAIRREVFLDVPDLDKVGYGIELAINYHVKHLGLPRRDVPLKGVTHPMKEEKLGFVRGALSRARMYQQMFRFWLSYKRHGCPPQKKDG